LEPILVAGAGVCAHEPDSGKLKTACNVYLHYVDLWFEQVVKPRLPGEAYVVRCIDDNPAELDRSFELLNTLWLETVALTGGKYKPRFDLKSVVPDYRSRSERPRSSATKKLRMRWITSGLLVTRLNSNKRLERGHQGIITLAREMPIRLRAAPPFSHPRLISVAETNDLSRRQLFHTHIVQVADVLGSDAAVAEFGDVRDGESIWQRTNLLEIFRLDPMVT
jgi:hypothetical protein